MRKCNGKNSTADLIHFTNIHREPKDDSTMKMYKRQANLIRQKKDKLQMKLDTYKEDYSKLMEQKKKLEDELKQYDGLKIPTDSAFEEYKQELLKKATKCKQMKTELAEIEAEIQVIQDTQNVKIHLYYLC